MTTEQYEQKYLGKYIAYDVSTKRTVYGRIDSINRETALGQPEIIFKLYRGGHIELYQVDEEYFEELVKLLPDGLGGIDYTQREQETYGIIRRTGV